MRLALALLLLAIAGCRKTQVSPPSTDASLDVGVVASASSVAPPKAPPRLSSLPWPRAKTLLSNGHVLFDGHGHWDWDGNDPQSARAQRLDIEGDDVAIYLGPRDAFVAQISEPPGKGDSSTKKRRLEIWDGLTRTKMLALPDKWQSGQPWHAFSDDGTHFLYQDCDTFDRPGEEGGNWFCDIGVYAFPAGKLVHRSKILVGERSRYYPSTKLSPDGRYFSVEIYEHSVRVFDSATGKNVLSVDGHDASLVAIDGAAAIVRVGKKLTATNLATGKAFAQLDIELPKGEIVYRAEASPDRKRVAFSTTRKQEMFLGVWKVGETTVQRQAIPPSICTDCVLRWVSNTDVLVDAYPGGEASPKDSFHLDVESSDAGGSADVPSFAGGGFAVFPGTGDHGADVVVTPSKKRLEFPHEIARSCEQVRSDRLLYCTKTRARVIQRDGSFAELQLTND